jgi:ABC-type multidrug transport system ATPase subunit
MKDSDILPFLYDLHDDDINEELEIIITSHDLDEIEEAIDFIYQILKKKKIDNIEDIKKELFTYGKYGH